MVCKDVELEGRELQVINSARGLLCIWRKGIFEIDPVFSGNGFLGIKGLWKEGKIMCVLVNVYASTDINKIICLYLTLPHKPSHYGL